MKFDNVLAENTGNVSTLVVGYLNLLCNALTAYFFKDNKKRVEANLQIMQTFYNEQT